MNNIEGSRDIRTGGVGVRGDYNVSFVMFIFPSIFFRPASLTTREKKSATQWRLYYGLFRASE